MTDGLEEADQRIIALLRQDGRMSYTKLGQTVGMSTSAVHQRVRRMERRGIIKGYTARVDEQALGRALTAFVEVTPLDQSGEDDVPQRLQGMPELEACHSIAGDANYLLKVRVATPGQLEELLARLRATAEVSTRTTIVLSTPWE